MCVITYLIIYEKNILVLSNIENIINCTLIIIFQFYVSIMSQVRLGFKMFCDNCRFVHIHSIIKFKYRQPLTRIYQHRTVLALRFGKKKTYNGKIANRRNESEKTERHTTRTIHGVARPTSVWELLLNDKSTTRVCKHGRTTLLGTDYAGKRSDPSRVVVEMGGFWARAFGTDGWAADQRGKGRRGHTELAKRE